MSVLRVRRIENGDLPFGRGQAAYASGGEATLQLVDRRLKTFLGEYWLDRSIGFPWRESVFKRTDEAIAAALIKAHILETDGVESLNSFSFSLDRNTRRLSVAASVKTTDGILNFAGVYP